MTSIAVGDVAQIIASNVRGGVSAKLAGDFSAAVRDLYNAQTLLLMMPAPRPGPPMLDQNYGAALRMLGDGKPSRDAVQIVRNYVAAHLSDAMRQLQSEKQRSDNIVRVFARMKELDRRLEGHSRRGEGLGDADEDADAGDGGFGKGSGYHRGAAASGAGESFPPPIEAPAAGGGAGGGGAGGRAKATAGGDDVDTGIAGSKSFEAKIEAFKTLEMTDENCVLFQDLVGVQYIEKEIKDSVVNSMLYPKLFPKQTKGLLLFGPPGTGKTFVVKAAATELRMQLAAAQKDDGGSVTKVGIINASGGQLTGKYIGESEKLVEAMWTAAERFSHTGTNRELKEGEKSQENVAIIFLDEAESVLVDRSTTGSSSGGQVSASIVNTFLAQMDGLRARNGARIFFIAATNYPHKIDGAIMRRFKQRVFFDLPENVDRAEMINNAIADMASALAVPVRVHTGPVTAKCERDGSKFQPFASVRNLPSAFEELVFGQKSHAELTKLALRGLVIPIKTDGTVIQSEIAKIQQTRAAELDKRVELRNQYDDKRTMAAMNFSHSDVATAMRTLFELIGSQTLATGVAVLRAVPLQPEYWPTIFHAAFTSDDQVRHLIFTEFDERLVQDQNVVGTIEEIGSSGSSRAADPATGKGGGRGRGGVAVAVEDDEDAEADEDAGAVRVVSPFGLSADQFRVTDSAQRIF